MRVVTYGRTVRRPAYGKPNDDFVREQGDSLRVTHEKPQPPPVVAGMVKVHESLHEADSEQPSFVHVVEVTAVNCCGQLEIRGRVTHAFVAKSPQYADPRYMLMLTLT